VPASSTIPVRYNQASNVWRQGILNPSAERTHVVNMVKAGRNTSATTQFVRLQTGCRYKSMWKAIPIAFMSTKPSPYQTSSQHCYTMSSPHLHSQADSGYQQRTAQPPYTLPAAPAPRPPSAVLVRVESVLTIEKAAVEHFALICTNTYEWKPISAADVQRLGALNIPTQIVLDGVSSGDSSFTGNEPERRYVFKSSSTISR
jgi:hypothetical protein